MELKHRVVFPLVLIVLAIVFIVLTAQDGMATTNTGLGLAEAANRRGTFDVPGGMKNRNGRRSQLRKIQAMT